MKKGQIYQGVAGEIRFPNRAVVETAEGEQCLVDNVLPGQKVVVVDDLIATGGTVAAAIKLIEKLGGEVTKCVFLLELAGLNGREKLKGYDVETVVSYEGK